MPSFEHRVSFAMPDVARKAMLPLPDLSCPNRVLEPTLHSVPGVGQVGRTDVGVRSAAVGRSGEAGTILVVWAANVPAGFGYFGQIDSMGRRDDLASLRVATLKTRLAHDSQSVRLSRSTGAGSPCQGPHPGGQDARGGRAIHSVLPQTYPCAASGSMADGVGPFLLRPHTRGICGSARDRLVTVRGKEALVDG